MSGFLCYLFAFVFIGVPILSVALKLSVWVYNSLNSGKPKKELVPSPSWGNAMAIIIMAYTANFFVNLLLKLAVAVFLTFIMQVNEATFLIGKSLIQVRIGYLLISTAVSLVVISYSLHKLLPTELDRAILVTLCYFVFYIILVIVLVIFIFIFAIGLFAAANAA